MNVSMQGGDLWIIALLWGMFVTIFWMVVGWRAMRAHEEIAVRMRRIADAGGGPGGTRESERDYR